MPIHSLAQLGLSASHRLAFATLARPSAVLGRVVAEHRGAHLVSTELGDRLAEPTGRLRHHAASRLDLPAVGDWVALEATSDGRALVHAVLPRTSAFVRGVAGGVTEPQVVAANVDVVVVVCAADDVNPRRLDRTLALVRASGAEPVIAITKTDLHPLDEARRRALEGTTAVAVHAASGVTGEGLAALAAYFVGHRTLALVGASGAGKSTLVNRLLGSERQATRALGVDGRGVHTTTHRELLVVPTGGLVIDTPGMRELRLWAAADGLDETFADVADLATRCRFADCAHEGEPGCAVRAALDDGSLSFERFASWDKLQREEAAFAARKDARAASDARRLHRIRSRAIRAHERFRR